MIIRFNNLKIELLAMDAKPGGLIGAMLSPYLFSTNLNDFCKRFNEQTKDFDIDIWLTVTLWCDVPGRVYTFKIKILSVARFIVYFLTIAKRIKVYSLYDLILYYRDIYKMEFYNLTILILSILRAIKRRKYKIILYPYILKKYKFYLVNK